MTHNNRRGGASSRMSYSTRSSPIPINREKRRWSGNDGGGGLSQWNQAGAEQTGSLHRSGQHGEEVGDFDLQLEVEQHQQGGCNRNGGGVGVDVGVEETSGNISGRYVTSLSSPRRGTSGVAHGGGGAYVEGLRDPSPGYSEDWTFGGGGEGGEGEEEATRKTCDHTEWVEGRAGESLSRAGGISSTSDGFNSRRKSSGAICIGGGGGSSVDYRWGAVTTEELKGDGGGGDLALGKSLDDPFPHGFEDESIYRKAEARNSRSAKNKSLGKGSSTGNLAGKVGGFGAAGGGGGRRGSKGSSSNNSNNSNSYNSGSGGGIKKSASGGGISSTKSAGGGGGGPKKKGGSGNSGKSSSSGNQKDINIEWRFDWDDGGRQIRRSQSALLIPKQTFSQVDMASARKSKTRARTQEAKKAIKEKGERCDAERNAARGLWETDVLPLDQETSSEGEDRRPGRTSFRQSGGYGPSFKNWFLLVEGEGGILNSIKKQSNRPLDDKVHKAQVILAKALLQGKKRVLLPGLELMYPQNVITLLNDAVRALEHNHLQRHNLNATTAVVENPIAWTKAWPPIKVMDLSRNNLQGIDSLLVVELPGSGEGGGDGAERAAAKSFGGAATRVARDGRTYIYPLEGIEELRLSGNKLHDLPRDMARVLPSLERLELYGNQINIIEPPEGPLLQLKHLNLGNNNLFELPSELCMAMPNLKELLLPNNQLEWLPRELASMQHLKLLDVSRNPLTSPPVEVASRGLESVRRYFRDVVEPQSDRDSAEERHVEVPNQVKVIFIGHSEAGKSQVIEGLESIPAAMPRFQDSNRTHPSSVTGSRGSDPRRLSTTPSNTSGYGRKTSSTSTSTSAPGHPGAAVSPHGAPHQHDGGGAPPKTPPLPPLPPPLISQPSSDKDDEGWQVVGTSRQRPAPATSASNSTVTTPTSSSNRPQAHPQASGAPSYGTGALGSSGSSWARRWETASAGYAGVARGGHAGSREGTTTAGSKGGLRPSGDGKLHWTPGSPEQVAMDIHTVTYTPTQPRKGRKHLSGEQRGEAGRGDEHGGDNNASGAATPRLSGCGGGGGEGKNNITLKMWDFGGTEEFHAVHGLFFSRRALYTVVFDLRRVERDEIDERIQFWVDCVQSRVPGSLILLVGTHADCMSQAEAQAKIAKVKSQLDQNEERIVSGLRSAEGNDAAADLSHLQNRPKIERRVIAVSCKHHQGFREFRQQVLNLAGDAQRFPPSRLPPAWVEADRLVKLRRLEGHHILSVRDLVAGLREGVASREVTLGPGSSRGGESVQTWEDARNAVVSTLEWLNDTSEVVYFNKSGLDEFVILHPLHLMGAIKQIVRRDLKEKLIALVRHHQDTAHRAATIPTPSNVAGGSLPPSIAPCPSDYPPLTPALSVSEQGLSKQQRSGASSGDRQRQPASSAGTLAMSVPTALSVATAGDEGVPASAVVPSPARSGPAAVAASRSTTAGTANKGATVAAVTSPSSREDVDNGSGGAGSVSGGKRSSSRKNSRGSARSGGRKKSNSRIDNGLNNGRGSQSTASAAAPSPSPAAARLEAGPPGNSGRGAWENGPPVGGWGKAAVVNNSPKASSGGGGRLLSPASSAASAVGYVSSRISQSSLNQTRNDVSNDESTKNPSSLSLPEGTEARATATAGMAGEGPASRGSSAPAAATSTGSKRPSYLEKLATGTVMSSGVGPDGGGGGGGGVQNPRRTRSTGSSAAAVAGSAARAVLSCRDEVRLDSGFVSRAVIDALLEPLAEFNCDKTGREFLIRLFQESCVLVKAMEEPPTKGVLGAGTDVGYARTIARSQSLESARLSTAGKAYAARRESEVEYFIPCVLPTRTVEWTESWVSNVHCGRRWEFQRFVPPSLMSALLSRFYGMGKRGSASLSRSSIYIKVPIGGGGCGGGDEKRSGRGRGEAEVLLRLHRGIQKHAFLSPQSPRLELLAQTHSRRREDLMRSLGPLVDVVDETLGEFPGLLVERKVPCPACMERRPGDPAAWGGLPLVMVEEKRSCPGDLPRCKNQCQLQDLQKRLMFVGELLPDGEESEELGGGASHCYHEWDSHLPQLGAPRMRNIDTVATGVGGVMDGAPQRGFGVPLVDTLYPAVCPIAIYDCNTQSVRAQATAFIVKSELGYLLTAAHTFLEYKVEKREGGRKNEAPPRGKWGYYKGMTHENCVVLVGMFEPPYTTKWEFVAEAIQHGNAFRSKVYSDIGWNKDHPVLLRIKLRFDPISTRVVKNLKFEGLTYNWRDRSPGLGDPEVNGSSDQQQRQNLPRSGLVELELGDSRMVQGWPKGDAEHRLDGSPSAMLAVLEREDSELCMSMAVFPQELLTLVAFPEHGPPCYSSVSVTHGPVYRNMVGQDVIEVLLSNHRGASGGPVVSKRGEVVGILSQGNQYGAYVMGISTAKTLLSAPVADVEAIFTEFPLIPM